MIRLLHLALIVITVHLATRDFITFGVDFITFGDDNNMLLHLMALLHLVAAITFYYIWRQSITFGGVYYI